MYRDEFHLKIFYLDDMVMELSGGIIVCESKPEDKVSNPSIRWSKSANNCWYFYKFLSILADILPYLNAKNLIAFALSLTFQMNLSITTSICITHCVSLSSLLLLSTMHMDASHSV